MRRFSCALCCAASLAAVGFLPSPALGERIRIESATVARTANNDMLHVELVFDRVPDFTVDQIDFIAIDPEPRTVPASRGYFWFDNYDSRGNIDGTLAYGTSVDIYVDSGVPGAPDIFESFGPTGAMPFLISGTTLIADISYDTTGLSRSSFDWMASGMHGRTVAHAPEPPAMAMILLGFMVLGLQWNLRR